jgi:L-threonylcarbamoyladenylate synthase
MSMTNEEIVAALGQPGAIGVVASDTVYGVVARAVDRQAVMRLYELKHRERKPGTVVAADIDQLVRLGLKRRYLIPVAQFWPGAVSVIIPCADEMLAYIHQGVQSLAVRVPSDEQLLDLLRATGPLVTSSANQPGKPPANTIAEAQAYFGNKVDFYADAGDLSGREPSTVVRVIDDVLEVVRQGAVHINEQGEIEHDI